MTREAFVALVRRIEARYEGRPAALERAVGLWSALGLVGLLSWLLLVAVMGLVLFVVGAFVEAPTGAVMICVGAPLLLFSAVQAACILGTEAAPPTGRLLTRGEAPPLDRALDELRRAMDCRPFDEVRLTSAFNAGVSERPRLGLLGWPRTVLEIGLPLARATAPDELRAILAHEFAHQSARHGRSAGRLHRLDRRWGNLFRRMQRPAENSVARYGRTAVARFVGWYWPRLHARALVLSRRHEFQADREAARVVGDRPMATALWRLEMLSPWLVDRFWPGLFALAADRPDPPADVLSRMTAAMASPPSPEDAALWTERGLVRATLHDETHPALLDRVRPLGFGVGDLRGLGFPAPPASSAAEAFLGDLAPAAERALSEEWRAANLGVWRDRHRRAASEARRRLGVESTRIDSPSASPPSDVDETRTEIPAAVDVPALWETARAAAELRGADSAEPLLRRVLELDPLHDGAAVVLGRRLASLGDPEGEAMLRRVLDRGDETWLPAACEALRSVYGADGRTDRLREVLARLDRHEADLAAARRERAVVAASDVFLPHDLSDDQLAPLRALLASFPEVAAAWLVRKRLRTFPNRPLFVLCVRGRGGVAWRWSADADQEQALVRRLSSRIELPGQVLVVARRGAFRALARALMKRPGAEVFRRDATVAR